MTTVTIRTYETFSVRWDRGSTWSGYASAAEAQAVVDFAGRRIDEPAAGVVVRETFEVRWFAGDASIIHARPGIAERFEEVAL